MTSGDLLIAPTGIEGRRFNRKAVPLPIFVGSGGRQ